MKPWLIQPDFLVRRDPDRCIQCQVCVRQCANDVHIWDSDNELVLSEGASCVGCHRCSTLCPTGAIDIVQAPLHFLPNSYWTPSVLKSVYKQAEGGGVLLAVSKTGGNIKDRSELDSPPVFDGLAAARGRLYLSTQDGVILCFAGR